MAEAGKEAPPPSGSFWDGLLKNQYQQLKALELAAMGKVSTARYHMAARKHCLRACTHAQHAKAACALPGMSSEHSLMPGAVPALFLQRSRSPLRAVLGFAFGHKTLRHRPCEVQRLWCGGTDHQPPICVCQGTVGLCACAGQAGP